MFGGGGSGAMLLGIPEVQNELNLSEGQKKEINGLLADAREKVLGQINFQDLRNLSADEREKRFGELRKKFEEVGKGIDEKAGKFLDTKQSERLHQLVLQREGAMALARPDVSAKLGLGSEQMEKIKKIQEDARPSGSAFGRNQSSEDRQAAMKKLREQFEKAQKDCFAVLNDDQMLDWTNMCGKTFKFPERQPFSRGSRQRTPPQQ